MDLVATSIDTAVLVPSSALRCLFFLTSLRFWY